ncbi:MAG TPA: tyrosine-type recombinase/integrase [Anaerolineales bacterium]
MIDEDIARYLGHLKYVQGGAKNTILAYRTDLQQFRQVLRLDQGTPVDTAGLSRASLKAYFEWLARKQFRPATVARKLAALRSFFGYMEENQGLATKTLVKSLRLPAPERKQPRSLSRAQLARLLEAPSGGTSARDLRDSAILSFVYATGLRAADAVEVTIHDLNLTRGLLDRPGASTDPLPLGISRHALERYVKDGRPQLLRNRGEPALFLNQRGQRLSRQGLWLVVKKWSQACNLGEDVSPYTLRHSLTRHLLQQGRSRQEVQHLLGLASPSTIRFLAG